MPVTRDMSEDKRQTCCWRGSLCRRARPDAIRTVGVTSVSALFSRKLFFEIIDCPLMSTRSVAIDRRDTEFRPYFAEIITC